MTQTGTITKLQNKRHENKNMEQNQKQTLYIPPPLRAAPDAQTKQKQKPKSPGGWLSGGGTDIVQGVGWRARPVKGNRTWSNGGADSAGGHGGAGSGADGVT